MDAIVDHLERGYNIVVDAVAGSGKTTTVISLVESAHKRGQSSLVLMYNASVAASTRKRCRSGRAVISTVHAAFHNLCGCTTVHNDDTLDTVLSSPLICSSSFDVLVVDEAQDLDPLLARAIHRLITLCRIRQLVFLGDSRQCIYGFKGARPCYLTDAPALWESELCWVRLGLTCTYRLTQPMTHFVNTLLDQNILSCARDDEAPAVVWVTANKEKEKQLVEIIVDEVRKDWKRGLTLAVLIPSFDEPCETSLSVVNGLAEHWSFRTVGAGAESVGIVSTPQRFKGLEADIVVVTGFNRRNTGEEIPTHLPNVAYVAATRARYKLIVVENAALSWYRPLHHSVKRIELAERTAKLNIIPSGRFSVRSLVKFMSLDTVTDARAFYKIKRLAPPMKEAESLGADVERWCGRLVGSFVHQALEPNKPWASLFPMTRPSQGVYKLWEEHQALAKNMGWIDHPLDKDIPWRALGRWVVLETAIDDGLAFLAEVDPSWIDPVADRIADWANAARSKWMRDVVPELGMAASVDNEMVTGRVDGIICNSENRSMRVVELKTTRTLTVEHQLQTALYVALANLSNSDRCEGWYTHGILFNARTGEAYRVDVSKEHSADLVRCLINARKQSGDPGPVDPRAEMRK